nr:putative KHDC1-like protein [Loxodonta africana]
MAERGRRERARREKPWWTVPENFVDPLVFYMDQELEEHIFGPSNADLCCIEEHSCTLIQLEPWFSASGQMRVTVVGPILARRWLLETFLCLGIQGFKRQAQGRCFWLNYWLRAQRWSSGGVVGDSGFSRAIGVARN